MPQSFSMSQSYDSLSSNDTDDSIESSVFAMNATNEDILLANHGYIKHDYVCKTLQGELFTAKMANNCQTNNAYVAIKKTSKRLYTKREAMDCDGFNFIVDEDIVKEASILRHLTVFNKPIGDTIVNYVDFVESETDFYLITEYIENSMTLKDFVIKSHEYIKCGKLKLKNYHQILKYLMWQLTTTIHWLHNDMHCCHLDLVVENILLKNAQFSQGSNGAIYINPRIELKLIDFGVSDMFASNSNFKCNKQHITIENEQYLSPNMDKQSYYDASASDMWSFGIIVYFCFIGKYPYKTIQETDFNEPVFGTGYWSICKNKLKSHLRINGLLDTINPKTLSLLTGLLNIDERKRLKSLNVLQHQWFSSYYKRYSRQIGRKSSLQRKQLLYQRKC